MRNQGCQALMSHWNEVLNIRLATVLRNRLLLRYIKIVAKMSALPKPVLRGHLGRSGLRMLAGAVTFSIVTASMYKFLVGLPREKAYQEYIRTYNPDKHFEELVKYGVLQSVKMVKEKQKSK